MSRDSRVYEWHPSGACYYFDDGGTHQAWELGAFDKDGAAAVGARHDGAGLLGTPSGFIRCLRDRRKGDLHFPNPMNRCAHI